MIRKKWFEWRTCANKSISLIRRYVPVDENENQELFDQSKEIFLGRIGDNRPL